MPRSLVRGSQVLDRSIEADDLATDSVITEKIKDHNVTCDKLASGICERLLSSDAPIGREVLLGMLVANQDFLLPNGLSYDSLTFIDRVAIFRNGQLLYNGATAPTNDDDPTEVYPGSTNQHIKFCYELFKGDRIQVIIL